MLYAVVALAALALVSAAISAYLTTRQRRLLHEAADRERERQRLADQLITAEQDERRRLALFLHDGPVQSLSGIALLLDGVDHAIGSGQSDQAQQVLRSALARHRETIRELRERDGEPPEPGEELEEDGRRYVVIKVAGSPLPGDARRCAYLQA